MYDFSVGLVIFIVILIVGLFAIKLRFTGTILSIVDIFSGLMIMGLSATNSFTPFNLTQVTIHGIGVAVLIKGVYCFILSRR
jgi:hypothetical protein